MTQIEQAMPSVRIAPELGQYFDRIIFNTPKFGQHMTKIGFTPDQITDTHVNFAVARTREEKRNMGMHEAGHMAIFPKRAIKWGFEEAAALGSPDKETVDRLTSLSLDLTVIHELSHRQDDLDAVLSQKMEQYTAMTNTIRRRYIIPRVAQFLSTVSMNTGYMELLANERLLSATMGTVGVVAVGLAGAAWMGRQAAVVGSEVNEMRYRDAPHEERARNAEVFGPRGFFDISIKPEYLASL
jgi:hypothetical protein